MLLKSYLSGKIHGIRLTDKSLHYQGSITLSRSYLQASGIAANEAVQVVNVNTGGRLWTYVLETDRPGVCALNGAAARMGEVGDPLIVMAFAQSDQPIVPRIVLVEGDNRIGSVQGG